MRSRLSGKHPSTTPSPPAHRKAEQWATATKAHKYKGIWPTGPREGCLRIRRVRSIRTKHSSGTPWADDQCAHAYTLAQAKGIVDGMVLIYELEREYSNTFDCECFHTCGQDSHSGRWHQHEDEPCPVHKDAPVVG